MLNVLGLINLQCNTKHVELTLGSECFSERGSDHWMTLCWVKQKITLLNSAENYFDEISKN
jgi:hypothetical protein